MIVDLLEMRFNDEEVKRRIESADTSMKKRLASQYFATRLSEKLNVVLSGTQVSTKYKKLKCEYRQGKSARSDTGNIGREDDSELWVILNSFFVGRPGIAGAVLADAEEEEDYPDNDVVFNSSVGKSKTVTPLTHLADAMKEGMTALAASMSSDEKLATAIQEMKNAQLATQQLQAKQLTLLELLLNKFG
ncbi:hypothetical protein PPTG_11168 [Phytophthora nicotianae INRA-310]|uniref:Uncharacterized protein n=2 Tax=Phytophthora nicotianae TaxID=4792 RepID=W2Q8D8_PHYN3|nr:hypothetical protein PPTG_11168 [Phytophthora nicotianae INRA-310]ETN09136.1 hypothetical protein PPTG_11168 [Phytophthora nicotianae INRA-310]ETO75525.1 hypothetical protein F444_08899 [Phytophthora nicotianae P1976]